MAEQCADAAVRLSTPAGRLPGQQVLVLVELLDDTGRPDRGAWDAEATLMTDQPGITLSPETIPLRNGLGTALVSLVGVAGDFKLNASIADETDSRSLASLAGMPVAQVSGRLEGNTVWRGVVRVTSNVTVPAGSTLSIEPGTVVLLDGVDLGTGGTSLIVEGAIQSLGTEAEPVVFDCADSRKNWGQIRHENAAHSVYRHTFIHKAGRVRGEGHTDTGPAIRALESSLLLDHCVISDITANGKAIGKIMMATDSDLVFESCVFARARMGPEIAGTSLLCRDTFILDMTGPDDADGIYLHDSNGKRLMLDRCVIAFGNDDGVDTINSQVTLQNSIVRDFPNTNGEAKGISVFHGKLIVRRCLVANCYVGVSAKSSGPLAGVSIEHCTIDASTAGVAASTKSNARVGNIAIHVRNSIVLADEAIRSDFGNDKITVEYSNTSQPWAGTGNLSQPPRFIDAAGGDYRLLAESPCVNAGDPAAPPDADDSRTDIGFRPLTGAPPEESWVQIVSPTGDTGIQAPGVTPIEVLGHMVGIIKRVDFFVNGEQVGTGDSPPYRFDWANRRVGEFTLSASAHDDAGGVVTSPEVRVNVIRDRQFTTQILIEEGSVWKYLDDGIGPRADWVQSGFDDSGWGEGPAELGYGENDEATVVGFGPDLNDKFITTWFRKTFQVPDAALVGNLPLRLLRDDGVVVYLNGKEALRVNLPDGVIDFQTMASGSGDYNFGTWQLDAGLIKTGANVIAVEIHQSRPSSSDISFDLELTAELALLANSSPFVTLERPAPSLLVANGAMLVLAADAFDLDGRIERVEFLSNDQIIGTVPAEPFEFTWHPTADGDFALVVVAWDDAGDASTSLPVRVKVSSDTAPPGIASQSPAPGLVTALSQVTVVFTKPVLEVDAADLLLNGLPAESVSGGGDTWRFTFAEPAYDTVAVSWTAEHGITDRFTPAHPFDTTRPESSWVYDYVDIMPPVIHETNPAQGVTVSALREMTVKFSEPVTGVDAADLWVKGVPAHSVSGVGRGPYRFQFAQQASGRIRVAWMANHGIRDTHGNLFAEEQLEIRVEPGFVGVIINEIMYHPSSRDDGEEYIELLNRNTESVALYGWRFARGVDFDFPEITLPPSGRLVLAANPEKFRAKYPGVKPVVGGWRGRLSNSHDTLILVDAKGREVDRVAYADEGDWAHRVQGPLDREHHGWRWQSGHDGLGRSLELVNPALPNEFGQNWAASEIELGTPGQANSTRRPDLPPMIVGVAHFPVVPRSIDPVLISSRLIDESNAGLAASLHYRIASGEEPEAFETIPMHDDGRAGDALAGDGIFSAVITSQPADTVVEFFIEAIDALDQARTWPAPALRLDGSLGQAANLLYQVDDAPPGDGPLYRLIMTRKERRELEETGNRSDAQVNATFVSHDGTRTECRHLVGIRGRGHGSRARKPDNFRVNFRSDVPWKNRTALNLNGQYSWPQHLGATLSLKAGATGAHAWEVRVRVNNRDPAASGPAERTHGFYAANEVFNSQWAEWHFPSDNSGNLYRARRDIAPSGFGYRGENPDDYRNTWFKASNTAADDWSDLIGMLRVLDPEAELLIDDLRQVIDVEQWLTHLAVMALLNSRESGLNTGFNDDYLMYRGTRDPRFILLFYDLDTIVNEGDTSSSPEDTLFGADRLPVFDALLHHPEIEPIYRRILLELVETVFSEAEFDALLEQTLDGTVSETTRSDMKSWMNRRRQFVINQLEPLPTPLPRLEVAGEPRSPTPLTSATLRVTSTAEYRFKLDDDPFGAETAADIPIELFGLANGTHTVSILARTADGTWPPEADALTVSWDVDAAWPSVRFNEILAINQATIAHEGAFHGYIELFNEGTNAANLSGMSVAHDPGELDGFQFPAGTVLNAGGILLLFADDHLPLGFGLDATGGEVFLIDTAANGRRLLDSVKYGQQIADLPLGRVHGGQWQLNRPTPGAANRVQPTGDPAALRINEWLALGGPDDPDGFVELFNSLDLPVPLGGLALTDRPSGLPGRVRIPPLSFIAAKEFRLFDAGGDSARDAHRLGFRLDSGPGEIALFGPDGAKLDHVVYGPQIHGRSMGRCPDGGARQTALTWPSPGAANFCPGAPQTPGEARLIAFDHTWKYNDSGSDLGTGWKASDFDDSEWLVGAGLLGLEDESLPEPLRTTFENIDGKMTYYFRTTFEVDPGHIPATARVTHLIDDGAVFYLNGEEFGVRFDMTGDEPINFLTRADAGEDADRVAFELDPALLRLGMNTLAVEVHQSNPRSSDVVFGLQLDTVNLKAHPIAAGVYLNEVLAQSDSSGWVELFNPADFAVNLHGLGLTDRLAQPHRWTFAVDTIIEPRGFLRIELMPGQPASANNSGFGLPSAGGALHLTRRADERDGVLDSLRFGLLPSGGTIGRTPDVTAHWTLTHPTPLTANIPASTGSPLGLRINEWMVAPANGGDWIELFNSGTLPVDLSGLSLTDRLAKPDRDRFPPLSFIGAHAFLQLISDDRLAKRSDYLGFKLNRPGETIGLATPNGILLDAVTFGRQTTDVSEGRYPDGATAVTSFPGSSTPGAPNHPTAPVDADHDSLPDEWEIWFGLDTSNPADATLDTDADGLDNLSEFAGGLDPSDPESTLTIQAIQVEENQIVLVLRAPPNRLLWIQKRETLERGAWQTLREFRPTADPIEVTLPISIEPRQFFRLAIPAGKN